MRICRLRRSRAREELATARGICPGGPTDLPASSAGPSWPPLLPDRRAILDNVVDGYPPVVAGLECDIGQIEASMFSGAASGFGGPCRAEPAADVRPSPPRSSSDGLVAADGRQRPAIGSLADAPARAHKMTFSTTISRRPSHAHN